MKFVVSFVSMLLLAALLVTSIFQKCEASEWLPAEASFHGTRNGSGTDYGACGFTRVTKTPRYGRNTTSVSSALFQGGAACGACYEVKCERSRTYWCKTTASVFVTVTDFCPVSPGNFCGWPKASLSLSQVMYTSLFWTWDPIVLPVKYRRVACRKFGGIQFRITEGTNSKFLMIRVSNTNGAGDIAAVEVSFNGGKTWYGMYRNWGVNWSLNDGQKYSNRPMSFRVKAQVTNERVTALNVIPKKWTVKGVYTSKVNFKVRP